MTTDVRKDVQWALENAIFEADLPGIRGAIAFGADVNRPFSFTTRNADTLLRDTRRPANDLMTIAASVLTSDFPNAAAPYYRFLDAQRGAEVADVLMQAAARATPGRLPYAFAPADLPEAQRRGETQIDAETNTLAHQVVRAACRDATLPASDVYGKINRLLNVVDRDTCRDEIEQFAVDAVLCEGSERHQQMRFSDKALSTSSPGFAAFAACAQALGSISPYFATQLQDAMAHAPDQAAANGAASPAGGHGTKVDVLYLATHCAGMLNDPVSGRQADMTPAQRAMIQSLAQADFDVNRPVTANGHTLAMLATLRGEAPVLASLLDNGADPYQRDHGGLNTFAYLAKCTHKVDQSSCLTVLRAHEATSRVDELLGLGQRVAKAPRPG